MIYYMPIIEASDTPGFGYVLKGMLILVASMLTLSIIARIELTDDVTD